MDYDPCEYCNYLHCSTCTVLHPELRDLGQGVLSVPKTFVPSEDQEQATVVEWLRLHDIRFTHVPNGGNRHIITGARLKRLGVSKGFPDLLIVDPPPSQPGKVGTVIEMKRRQGGRLTIEQKRWLDDLKARNWYVAVCHGAGEAIDLLIELGYGRREAG